MQKDQYERLLSLMFGDISEYRDITTHKPLLAHYTTMPVVDSILRNPCLWMSNPLNMNDYQEVGYGIHLTLSEVQASQEIRTSFRNEDAYGEFLSQLSHMYEEYGTNEVKDTFVSCFSEHNEGDIPDGKLSMWRGYGDFGDGAAIIFDTKNINLGRQSPFILAEVQYLGNSKRLELIRSKISRLASFIEFEGIGVDQASGIAHVLFRRAVLASIFTKHEGFSEEREWRLVYSPDRDSGRHYRSIVDCNYGAGGLEPKMKVPLMKGEDGLGLNLDLDDALHSIIIGPRAATPMSLHAAQILLRKAGKENLSPKLKASTIPFRR